MNKQESAKFKLDHVLQVLANEELFGQWLRNFFYLNDALNKKYDTNYQNSFYVVFYELVTVGLEYSETILESIKDSKNSTRNL